MARMSKNHCLEDLRRRILATELAPGADLDEAGLSADYGMSRTPLREVLQRLQGEGFVELLAHRGAKVASMDIAVLRTFFQTAPMIYANIARLAAENRTPAQLDRLKAAQRDFADATGSGGASEAALANHRFHATIGEMAQNPYLVASLARLLIDHTRLSQTFYRPASPQEDALVRTACAQHDAMITAIAEHNGNLATELTLQHWDLSRDRLERFVRPDPLPVALVGEKETRDAI
ncbi:MAG: GntR family transcriptional regulator [Rhodobacteraceae bacterium]|nr:GntR family transcriptional regulator [Paracoccaceae bacterium]